MTGNLIPNISSRTALRLALVLIVAVGWLDYITGSQAMFIVFYLLPIALTWYVGKRSGIGIAILCGVAASSTEFFWNIPYTSPLTPYWNSMSRLVVFVTIAYLIAVLREQVNGLEETIEKRTQALVEQFEDQQRVERALSAAENKYQNLLKSVQLAAIIVDCRGIVTFCNDFFLAMTGRSLPEVIDRNWFELFVPAEERESRQHSWQSWVAARAIPSHRESAVVTHDGKRRVISWNYSLLLDADGTPTGVAGIGSDITDRQLLEAQLIQAQKMEGIGQLAGGVAHDFNNILTVIMGFADLLQMHMPPDDVKLPLVNEIVAAVDRASDLTRNLLAFSRKQELKLQPVYLDELMLGLQASLPRLLPEEIALSFEVHSANLLVMADKGQLEHVIVNLAVNARDAMPNGGVLSLVVGEKTVETREVTHQAILEPGRYAYLSVSDNGTGMDSETCTRIFEPFFTTKEVGKGTGLGLSMAYGIVKNHRGDITVDSQPGTGTDITIYLPFIDANPLAKAGGDFSGIPGGTETILLVEDDHSVRSMLTMLLTEYGYDVIKAPDGEQAVSLSRQHGDAIDLLITDVIMPLKNGREVFDQVRLSVPCLPVLYISGYPADFIIQKGVQPNDVDFLAKPLDAGIFLRKIRDILDTPQIPIA